MKLIGSVTKKLINFYKQTVYTYTACSHCNCVIIAVVVVLSGSSQNADFAGFLIQGRMAADGTTRVGTFVANGGDQRTACSGVSAIICIPALLYQQMQQQQQLDDSC